MVSLLSENWEDTDRGDIDPMSNPMEKLAELEARMALKDSHQEAATASLRKELHDTRDKMNELILLLETIKSFVRVIGMFEKGLIFFTKVAGSIAIMYAVYKFGLMEIAERVKAVGGK